MIVLFFIFSLFAQLTSFEVIGSVRDIRGQIVPGVRISVTDENFQPIYTAFVDGSGRFNVKVKTGKYIFRIDTTGTPYQELQTNWIELVSLRKTGGATEVYPMDLILKFKPGNDPAAKAGTTFAQDVPSSARSEFERATKGLKSNKTDVGIASLKKAIEIFPDYFDALELLGTEYVKDGQYDPAIPILKHALEINSRAPRSFYALGVAYLKLNQIASAIDSLEKASKLDASNPNTQMMIGLAYGNSGAFDKSEAAFKKALQTAGAAAAESHFYLAGLYNKLSRFQEAAQELELYLKEAKGIKDPPQIKAMISRLKEKALTQSAPSGSGKIAETTTPEGTQKLSVGKPDSHSDPAVQDGVESSVETVTRKVPLSPGDNTLRASAPPLSPEMTGLLSICEGNGGVMHRYLLDYTYRLKKTRRILNSTGKPIHSLEQVFEAYPIRGEHVLILLSRDGIASKHLSDDRKQAVRQLEEAERQSKRSQQNEGNLRPDIEGYVSAGVTGVHDGQPGYVSISVSEFLRVCEFFSPRIQDNAGRSAIVMNFRPRAGVTLPANYAYISRLVGMIWIDQEDKIITRLEGWPDKDAAFDLVQTTAPRDEAALIYQQTRLANGIWFPMLIRMNAGGRNLFNGLNWDVVFEFSDYRRFNTGADDLKIKLPPPPDK